METSLFWTRLKMRTSSFFKVGSKEINTWLRNLTSVTHFNNDFACNDYSIIIFFTKKITTCSISTGSHNKNLTKLSPTDCCILSNKKRIIGFGWRDIELFIHLSRIPMCFSHRYHYYFWQMDQKWNHTGSTSFQIKKH